jgi:polar amino acid transport system substrate-binding protein
MLRTVTRRCAAVAMFGSTLLVLAMAACGGGGGNTGSSGGSATPSASTAVDQALAAKVPADVKSDGKILVGTDSTYAPNEFLDTDGKTVIGFEVDLFNAVAAKLGLKTEWQSAPFAAVIPGVQSGKYEIGVSSFTINADRKKSVNMVEYYSAGTQWAAKKGNPAGVKPDDACGKKIAVQKGTVQVDDLTARSKKCTDGGKPAITIDQYQAQSDATAALVSGKDDGMLADSPVCANAVKQTNGQLETVGDIYDAAPYGFVVKKEQADFADALKGAVDALISDGTYTTILKKWGVEGGAVKSAAVNP